jgi:hypothetical protein
VFLTTKQPESGAMQSIRTVSTEEMTQQQQQQQQQLQQQLQYQSHSQLSQGQLQPDAMVQLAAQVQSQVGASLASANKNPMLVATGPMQGSIMMNPNAVTGCQVIPMRGQIQNLAAAYQQIPVWSAAHQPSLAGPPGHPSQDLAPKPLLPSQQQPQQAPSGRFVSRFAAENPPLLNSTLEASVGSLPPQSTLHPSLAGPVPILDQSHDGDYDEPASDRAGKRRRSSSSQGGNGARGHHQREVPAECKEATDSYDGTDGTRTQQNRERNREHARSTRLRKKVRLSNSEDAVCLPSRICNRWQPLVTCLALNTGDSEITNETDRHTFKNSRTWRMVFVPYRPKKCDNVGSRHKECWRCSMFAGPYCTQLWPITRISKAILRNGICCWKTRSGSRNP